MNQEVQAALRMIINFEQTDWPDRLPSTQLALNNRNSSVTGVSPNLLTLGYTVDPLQKALVPAAPSQSTKGMAATFLAHLRDGMVIAQAAIALAQQRQMESTGRTRRPAEKFQVGDKVWFSMRNVKTNRPSKKLDWLQVKYTVTAVPSPLTVVLDLPGDLHKTVHVDLIERAASDPLESQQLVDARPGPVLTMENVDSDVDEYAVEEILRAKNARGRNKRQVLVKWTGWKDPSWLPLEEVEDTEALDKFEAKYGDARHNDGPKRPSKRRGVLGRASAPAS